MSISTDPKKAIEKLSEEELSAGNPFGPIEPKGAIGEGFISMELADRECARLGVSAVLDDPQPATRETRAEKAKKAETAETGPLITSIRMDTIEAQKIEWLWENRIPQGAVTIIEGEEGVGKSTLLCALAAIVSTGKGPKGFNITAPGAVLWLSAEEDLARVLKPRLLDARAECAMIHAIADPFTFDDQGLLALKEQIATHNPQIIVIDPIFAYLKGDANKGNDTRKLTNQLRYLAELYQVAIILVRHIGKSKGMGDPRAAGLSSIEWRAAARSVLLVGADPDNEKNKAVTQTKNNYGPKSPALGYTIESDPDAVSGAKFYWTGESDLTAERILAPFRMADDEDTNLATREADEFLRDALCAGERPAKEVKDEAKQCGISETTLNRVKRQLGVKSRQTGGGKSDRQKIWYWSLPLSDGHESLSGGHTQKNDHLTANHSDNTSYSNGLLSGGQISTRDHLTGGDDHLTDPPNPETLRREPEGREEFDV